MFKVEVTYFDAAGEKQVSKWGGYHPLTHPGEILIDVMGQMDPFMRPYDGDSVGTHGDPSDFHASLDRNVGDETCRCALVSPGDQSARLNW